MAVAGLVIGILGITVFWWAGPALGGAITSWFVLSGAVQGQVDVSTTPIWVSGLLIGVGLPLSAVGLSIGAIIKDEKSKGIAIAGLVLGAVAAILGLIFTFVGATGTQMAKEIAQGKDGALQSVPGFDEMQKQLNDPAFQQQIQDAMKRAQEMQQSPTPPPPPTPGTPPPPAAQPPAPSQQPAPPPQGNPPAGSGQPAGSSSP